MVAPIPPVPALPVTPAPGRMNVDFEQRVDFARLRDYRLARARAALEASDLGALLVFDNNNIRYLTGVAIGEWTRDKLCRYALYTRTGELFLWDFGSAAVHHRMYCPWLKPEHCIASYTTMRGATAPEANLPQRAVAEIKDLLAETGVAGPIFELARSVLAGARSTLGEAADYLDPIRLTEQQAGVEIRG